MNKYFVFLDIDGVFASARVQMSQMRTYSMWNRLDPIGIEFMSKIADTFVGIEFVLMSTWRHLDGFGERDAKYAPHWVESAFSNAGFRGDFAKPWRTEQLHGSGVESRPKEVAKYLEENPCDDFLLFDDDGWKFDEVLGKKRHIVTSPMDGLLFKHMEKAWSIVGMWDRK